jgi:hypothetical protein
VDERTWLTCTDPEALLPELHGVASERKLRLFASACVRRVWDLLERRSRQGVEVAEAYADGRADAWDLIAATQAALEARRQAEAHYIQADDEYELHLEADEPDEGGDDGEAGYHAYARLAAAGDRLAVADAAHRLLQTPPQPAQLARLLARVRWLVRQTTGISEEAEKARQALLLREVVGNPFRPVRLHPAWLGWADQTVPRLAEGVYEEGAFDRLPILADALEDAGCTCADILSHLRGPGPHVRGCWALDLILGLR